MRNVKVAVTQMACSKEHSENIEKAENLVRKAADQGANVILLQELFETPYFCKDQIRNILNERVLLKIIRYWKE